MNIDYHPFGYFDSVYTVGTSTGQWLYDPKTNTIYWRGGDMETKATTAPAFNIKDFFSAMEQELDNGEEKYGEGDGTLEFIRGIDPNFELGAIAKYISRIAHGDSRSETDIVKVATYAYLYWLRHYHASPDRKNT